MGAVVVVYARKRLETVDAADGRSSECAGLHGEKAFLVIFVEALGVAELVVGNDTIRLQ